MSKDAGTRKFGGKIYEGVDVFTKKSKANHEAKFLRKKQCMSARVVKVKEKNTFPDGRTVTKYYVYARKRKGCTK